MHVIRQLWRAADRYVRLAAAVRPAPELFVAEHQRIFDAVAAGDVDAALESLTANLRTTEKLLGQSFDENDQQLGELLYGPPAPRHRRGP
jgi:DNA-binding GntR family transcriptional regulator